MREGDRQLERERERQLVRSERAIGQSPSFNGLMSQLMTGAGLGLLALVVATALATEETADLSAAPTLAALDGKVEGTADAVNSAKIDNRKVRERIRALEANSGKWTDEAVRSAQARRQADEKVEKLRETKKNVKKVRTSTPAGPANPLQAGFARHGESASLRLDRSAPKIDAA